MPLRARLLTDDIAAEYPSPRTGRRELPDARQKGLFLRVTARGARTWSVTYKVAGQGGIGLSGAPLKGKARRITLGPLHVMDVRAARKRAGEVLADADNGIDPRTVQKAALEKRFKNTVKSAGQRMIDAATHKSKNRLEVTCRLHIFPRIGDRPLADLTRADVIELLDQLKAEGKTATAREVRKHLSKLLNWAADRAIIPANPISGLKDKTLKYVADDRALSDAELRAAWIAAGKMDDRTRDQLRLLMLTGCRFNEIASRQWSDIDNKARTLRIPPDQHKSARGHLVPLTDAAWSIVEEIKRVDQQSHLFYPDDEMNALALKKVSKKFETKRLNDFRALVHAQLLEDNPQHGELEHFTVHNLRHTAETHLAKLGVPQEHIDRVLGHAMRGMSATYNHYRYEPEMRAALDKLSTHILELAA